jgi:hypothetical protein
VLPEVPRCDRPALQADQIRVVLHLPYAVAMTALNINLGRRRRFGWGALAFIISLAGCRTARRPDLRVDDGARAYRPPVACTWGCGH